MRILVHLQTPHQGRIDEWRKGGDFHVTVIPEKELHGHDRDEVDAMIRRGALVTEGHVLGDADFPKVIYVDREHNYAEVHLARRMAETQENGHIGQWAVTCRLYHASKERAGGRSWFRDGRDALSVFERLRRRLLDGDVEGVCDSLEPEGIKEFQTARGALSPVERSRESELPQPTLDPYIIRRGNRDIDDPEMWSD